jgi:uncharacterized protein (TIGR03382 family)
VLLPLVVRLSSLVAPVACVLLAVACAQPTGSDDATTGSTTSNITSGSSCSLSKSTILNSVSGARRTALERGFKWFEDQVPYSQSKQHEGYRTDCSGFVSMCWEAGTPGETTASFPGSGKVKMLKSYDELIPGDAVDAPGHHTMLFVGWNDSAKSGACVIEQESTALGMQFHVRSTSSLKAEYKPMRALKLANDTSSANPSGPSTGGDDDNTTTAPGDDDDNANTVDPGTQGGVPVPPPRPSSPSSPPRPLPSTPMSNDTAECTPLSAIAACMAAAVDCGVISDGCGGTVNCDEIPFLFGCKNGQTCSHNTCADAPCTPQSATQICQSAKASRGIQCGSIPDGCGGSVNCDAVPSFGCAGQGTCGAENKCSTPAATPPANAPSSPPDPSAGAAAPESQTEGEPGDEGATKDSSSSDPPPAKAAASGGCNTSNSGTGGAGSSVLGLMLAAALLRRRQRGALRMNCQ